MEVAKNNFDLKMGERFAFGKGIYSTPDWRIAEQYAKDFTYKANLSTLFSLHVCVSFLTNYFMNSFLRGTKTKPYGKSTVQNLLDFDQERAKNDDQP